MPILIDCSNCHRKLRVNDNLLGKLIKCPNCRAKFPAIQTGGLSAAPAAATDAAEVLDQPLVTQAAGNSAIDLAAPPAGAQPSAATPATASVPRPHQRLLLTPVRVFGGVIAIIIVAGLLGMAVGWLVGSGINQAAERIIPGE
jgi:hypothetical protein